MSRASWAPWAEPNRRQRRRGLSEAEVFEMLYPTIFSCVSRARPKGERAPQPSRGFDFRDRSDRDLHASAA